MNLFLADLRAKARWCYQREDFRALLKTCATDGTAAMLLYRLMQTSRRWRLEPLAMLFNKLNGVFCGCIIGRGADFGPGFVLIHSQGVVINGNVRGGSEVHVEHQVTIGAEKNETPVLGNGLFIGAGAKILGGITIGDGVRVGANAVVVKDVPAHVTVGGIPARILRHHSAKDDSADSPETAPPALTDQDQEQEQALRGGTQQESSTQATAAQAAELSAASR